MPSKNNRVHKISFYKFSNQSIEHPKWRTLRIQYNKYIKWKCKGRTFGFLILFQFLFDEKLIEYNSRKPQTTNDSLTTLKTSRMILKWDTKFCTWFPPISLDSYETINLLLSGFGSSAIVGFLDFVIVWTVIEVIIRLYYKYFWYCCCCFANGYWFDWAMTISKEWFVNLGESAVDTLSQWKGRHLINHQMANMVHCTMLMVECWIAMWTAKKRHVIK